MDDGKVRIRRCEHRVRETAAAHVLACMRIFGGLKCELDRGRRATAFVERQQRGRMRRQRRRRVRNVRRAASAEPALPRRPVRARRGRRTRSNTAVTCAAPNSRLQLLPPKPKELLSTRRTGALRGFPAGSPLRCRDPCSCIQAARHEARARCASRLMAASTMPAAPSVWPVQPLVELQGVAVPNTLAHRAALGVVVRHRAGAVQIDVVDVAGRQRRALERGAHGGDRAAAVGLGRRHVIGIAGLAVAEQRRGLSAPGSSNAKPPASPIEMPLRAPSAGRQISPDMSCSELKPYSVVRHRLSTPPTTAASQMPAAIARRAAAKTFALDEQAVEIASAGPCKPEPRATKSATEKMFCVRRCVEPVGQRARLRNRARDRRARCAARPRCWCR